MAEVFFRELTRRACREKEEEELGSFGGYRSQFHQPGSNEPQTRISHPEFNEWVDGALRHYGFMIGASYGEAFTSAMPVPVSDPVEQYSVVPWKILHEEI